MSLHSYVRQEELSKYPSSQNVNKKHQKIFGGLFCLMTILVAYNAVVFVNIQLKQQNSSQPEVAGVTTENIIYVTPTPSIIPTVTRRPSPTPSPTLSLSKKSYIIAVIGDSMVDTMGERLEYLEHALKEKYPDVSFKLYNYGRGSENVIEGMNRFYNSFKYQDRSYPPITEINADIIIVASYGYNPLSPFDRDAHWLKLTEMVQAAQKYASNVYLLAEIAPLTKDFGKGPQGVNWDEPTRYEHSKKIQQQIENAIGLSRSLDIPLIDAYTVTKEDLEDSKKYVNTSDGIHPSMEGHEFMAEKIVESLEFK